MARRVRIESDDVLIIRTAPIFQPLLPPARYKSAQRLAMYPRQCCAPRWSPAPARARRAVSACAAQPSAAALADTCPGDRGNNPSCGFISPPLLRHSRCRSAAVIARSPSGGRPRFFVTFFVTGSGTFVTQRCTPQPTPGLPHNAHNGPTFSASQKKSGRDFKVRGPRPRTRLH